MTLFSEIRYITIGVGELERSIAFYAELLGFAEVGRDIVDTEIVGPAWRIPPGVTGRFAVMAAPNSTSGMLRLIEWTPAGDHVWSRPARPQDLAPYCFSARARDLAAVWKRVIPAGGATRVEPQRRVLTEAFAFLEAQATDPDGTVVSLFEPEPEFERALGPVETEVSEAQSVVIRVSDAARSRAFYEALGYETVFDVNLENADELFGAPKATKARCVSLRSKNGRPSGRVILAQATGPKPKSLDKRTVPPNRGVLWISIEARSLDTARMRLESLGAKSIARAAYTAPPIGAISAHTFSGPDGEAIEVFEAGGEA